MEHNLVVVNKYWWVDVVDYLIIFFINSRVQIVLKSDHSFWKCIFNIFYSLYSIQIYPNITMIDFKILLYKYITHFKH